MDWVRVSRGIRLDGKDVKGTGLGSKSVKGYWVGWKGCQVLLGQVAMVSVGIESGDKGYWVW